MGRWDRGDVGKNTDARGICCITIMKGNQGDEGSGRKWRKALQETGGAKDGGSGNCAEQVVEQEKG